LSSPLQQKTVDGQDNGASITYESRLFETQKFMTLTNHVYAMGTVASSSKFWARLSDAEKKILTDTAAEVTKKQIQKNRQLNADFLQKIEAGGIKITRPSAQAMAEFEKVGQGVWEKLSATYGADRIAALRQRPRPLASKRRNCPCRPAHAPAGGSSRWNARRSAPRSGSASSRSSPCWWASASAWPCGTSTSTLPDSGEIAIFAMAPLTFVGAAMCTCTGTHIAVDVIQQLRNAWVRRIGRLAAALAMIVFGAVYFHTALEFFRVARSSGERGLELGTPVAVPTFFFPLGMALVVLHAVVELIRAATDEPSVGEEAL
jgi:TRAP-type C4-dicarboxylate transport system permease small subunit